MNKFLYILTTLLLLFVSMAAQTYEFSRLDNNDGLSNNQINSIFKDSRGFMWFATNSGLNRYDGHRFKIFKYNKEVPDGINSDRVFGVQEDAEGNLWLDLGDSIYDIYHPGSEVFTHNAAGYLKEKGLPVHAKIIVISKQKDLYAYYKGDGIYWYNCKTKKITHFRQSGNAVGAFSKGDIMKFVVTDRFLWILFKNGLLERINKTTGKLDYQNTYYQTSRFKSTIVKTIFADADGDLWIYPSIDDKGAAYLDMKTLKWNFLENDKTLISGSLVRFVAQDNRGLFWIGTDHRGIHVYDKKGGQTTVLMNDIYNDNSISQNSTISGYCDNQGGVWIGTYKNGVCYYHPLLFKFKKPKLFYLYRENSETFDCNSFYKDAASNLWIGTNGSGLIRFNENSNEIQTFRAKEGSSQTISSDIITSITADRSNTLWIGTFLGGLNAFDGRSFRHYQFDENNANSLASKSVYGVAEDKDHNLWIATLGGGIDKLNPERTLFTHYNTDNTRGLLSNYVLSLHRGHNNDLFLSTDRGINWLTPRTNASPYIHRDIAVDKLPGEIVNNVLLDSRGLIWIATDKGMAVYHPKNKKYEYITLHNGLPNEEVVSLIEDNKGNVWAGTHKGLVRIVCSETGGKVVFSLTCFDSKDGLPSSVCNLNAIYKDRLGKIYVGTIKGYVAFDPANIVTNQMVPHPTFTELQISNRLIQPNHKYNGRVILKESISDLSELILNHNETNFSLMFSSLNYLHPDKNTYKYKLEGLDTEWNLDKQGNGMVSYSNLPPGTYRLVIYASNNDGVWAKEPLLLKIEVKPPFWATWWAYLIYFLTIVAAMWRFFRFKLQKQEKEFKQAQIVSDAKKMHEVDELKFKFFTNISHEFKTPITLIVAPVDKLMKEETSEEHKELLGIIRRNAMSLLNMVNEILEFRKLDLNKLSLKLTQGDIVDFTRRIGYSFSTLAKQKAIDFTFSSSLEKLQMEFDQEKMGRIITNLLSNAFKYTEYGEIHVNLHVVENLSSGSNTLLIRITDTGIGIAQDEVTKIFERFYRVDNHLKDNSTGTGVGLHLVSEYVKLHQGEISVESEPGKGSVFIVSIPIHGAVDAVVPPGEYSRELLENTLDAEDNAVPKHQIQNKLDAPLLLIVDDNEDFRNFLATLFAANYRLIFAQDGLEASGIVLDQLPDVVLCDVMMPRMNGYELCKKIKTDTRTANIPVILITAKTSDENKFRGFEAGADDYVSKPFSIDLLMLKVSRLVERRKSLMEAQKHKIDLSPSEIEITSEKEKFVRKAIAIVEDNMSNPEFLVEDLCRQMAMSRVGFYKQILAITEKTPSEFIRHIRLKRAADLLEKSELYVNEIAFQVGFNDPKYFRKYFKDEFGMTPNEYKKEHGK